MSSGVLKPFTVSWLHRASFLNYKEYLSQLLNSSWKQAMVGVFTPQESPNASYQGFISPPHHIQTQLLNIYEHTTVPIFRTNIMSLKLLPLSSTFNVQDIES